jgi:hypothetical protein
MGPGSEIAPDDRTLLLTCYEIELFITGTSIRPKNYPILFLVFRLTTNVNRHFGKPTVMCSLRHLLICECWLTSMVRVIYWASTTMIVPRYILPCLMSWSLNSNLCLKNTCTCSICSRPYKGLIEWDKRLSCQSKRSAFLSPMRLSLHGRLTTLTK